MDVHSYRHHCDPMAGQNLMRHRWQRRVCSTVFCCQVREEVVVFKIEEVSISLHEVIRDIVWKQIIFHHPNQTLDIPASTTLKDGVSSEEAR
jgi:hypothetical protein